MPLPNPQFMYEQTGFHGAQDFRVARRVGHAAQQMSPDAASARTVTFRPDCTRSGPDPISPTGLVVVRPGRSRAPATVGGVERPAPCERKAVIYLTRRTLEPHPDSVQQMWQMGNIGRADMSGCRTVPQLSRRAQRSRPLRHVSGRGEAGCGVGEALSKPPMTRIFAVARIPVHRVGNARHRNWRIDEA